MIKKKLFNILVMAALLTGQGQLLALAAWNQTMPAAAAIEGKSNVPSESFEFNLADDSSPSSSEGDYITLINANTLPGLSLLDESGPISPVESITSSKRKNLAGDDRSIGVATTLSRFHFPDDERVDQACPQNTTVYYQLEEDAAPYADHLGGSNATCTNCPSQITGRVGFGQSFDGLDDEVIVADDNDQFDWSSTDSFTIEYWMQNSGDCSGNEVIIGRDDDSTDLHIWTGCNSSGLATFQLRDTNGNGISINGTTSLLDNNWHHLVFVRNGSTDTNYVYVDGIEENTGTHDYTAGFEGAVPLDIGYLNLGGHYRYDGLLDEVAVYGRALEWGEIVGHFNAGAGRDYCELYTPMIISTEETEAEVGLFYDYDVDATGNPPPTYTLTTSPVGMVIDENSGLIEWTPSDAGDFDVGIEASNSEGFDSQDFTINVSPAYFCPVDPLAYWKMDDISVPPVIDEMDMNNGSCDYGAGACPMPATGLIDGALDFDGSNDEIDVVDDPSLRWSVSEDFTVAAWVRTTQDCSGNKVFIGKHLNSGEAYWWFGCTGATGTVEFEFSDSDGGGGHFSSGYSINDDAWHHIAAVIQRPDTLEIYVDGESRLSTTLGTALTGDLNSTRPLQIGHYLGSYNYDGLLDDVSVYQRALTETEIKLQHQKGNNSYGLCEIPALGPCSTDMISYHTLDDSAGPYTDLLGGPDANCTNCPAAAAGLVNGAQYFDGTDDEVNIPDNDQYDWSSTGEFSIEFWMRTNSDCAGNEVIIGRQGPTHPNPHIWTGCSDGNGDQAIFILFDSSGGNGGNGDWPLSGQAINDGEWHHIVVSRDTSDIYLYMDGTLRQAVAKPSYANFDSTTPFNLGYLNLGGNYRYNGDLDEVAFHDTALSPVEVLQHYDNGLGNQGYCSGPAVGTSSITIVKETNPDGGTGFQFSGDLGIFSLDDDSSEVFTSLAAGNYDVTETAAAGWQLTDVSCYGSGTPIADGVTIHLGDSEDVTCTFTNEPLPVPGVIDVTLTSTSGNDYTDDDLTCNYTYTSTTTTSSTAWFVDGSSQMAFFMPMEGGSAAEALVDRSGTGHSPVNNGAVWNSSSGHNDSGGFYFDSATINAGEVMVANGSYTKMAWVKQTGEDINNILSGDNTGTSHAFWSNCGPSANSFGGGHGGSWCDVEETFEPTLDVWYHVALTYAADTDTLRLYRDGVEVASGTATQGDTNDPTVYIGGYGNEHEWRGYMDDARIYNIVLSGEQIAAIHAQGGDVIDSLETAVGEEWQCQVTPYDDVQVGTPIASNNLTIQSLPGNGSINIIKETNPDGGGGFQFDGSLGSFSLDDDGSQPFTTLSAGDYDVTETAAIGWQLVDVTCSGSSTPIANGVTVHLGTAEDITCTFTNEELTVPACPVETIVYYQLEEASAPYADLFGGSNATCSNCPTQTTGQVGFGQSFDGLDDEVIVADDNDQFDWAATDSFTIEYWMQKSTACTGNEVIVGRDATENSLHWWTGCDASGMVRFQLQDTSGTGIYLGGSGDVINDGDWHHLVFVRDESIDENRIYVDGVETHQGIYDYANGFESIVPVDIGYLNLGGHYRYDGLLDEVAIYDRVLTDSEITAHYLNGQAGLAYCHVALTPPSITSTPVTDGYVGILYSYDVDAIGSPPVTYTLSINPAGMTIDENTGLIQWTPLSLGDFDVTVHANNSEGSDEQTFIITVNAITPCPADMSSYWKLDEISSGLYVDSFGEDDGVCRTVGACPAPNANGKINGTQAFTRTLELGVDIPVPGGGQSVPFDWGQNDSFTIEYWMKRDGPINGSQISDNEVIIGRDDPDTQLHWWFGMWYDGTAHFQMGDKTGDSVSVDGPAIDDGYWHHLVGVRDATAGINYLYVDGVQYSTSKPSYAGGFDSPTAALNLGWLDLSPGYYYTGLLDEVALYDRALTETEVKTHYYLARGYCQTCETPVDIMPLGDSITVGNASGVIPDNEAYWVSYRKDLWESLNDAGYDVDFVGGESHGYSVIPAFDHEHEGHGGWTDSQIRDNVVAFLSANPADVVLLHIGTNGLSADPDQVEEILDNIDSVSEDITVVMARIINRRDGSATTTLFNDNIENMALARMDPTSPSYSADKIIIVDMENGAGLIYGQAPASGDMWDNLHPYETGYAKMANVWLHGDSHGSDGLDDFMPVCAPPTPYAPAITSTPVTDAYQGWLYSYDVEADGFPAPTYSLTVSPTGMTIDPTTGLIEWTAGTIGDYDVTVEASNGVSPDATQTFIIHVGEAPVCPVDMISYWKLDETSGSDFNDFYDANHASCSSNQCPDFTAGHIAGALDFNGSSDYLTVPDNPSLDWAYNDSFSIELWANLTNCDSRNKVMIGRDNRPGDHSVHWWLGCGISTKTAVFNLLSTDDQGVAVTGSTLINDGEWHHIVAVRNETTNLNMLYVDGQLEDSAAFNYVAGFDATTTLGIGYMAYEHTPDYFYDGKLDEIAIYGRALGLSEIQDHFYNGVGKAYCDFGLEAPTILSTPELTGRVGELYEYDVYASGNPVPTYTLTTGPIGMTIDENSGLIQWTPTAVGDFDVTCEAHNSEGVDDQSFSIHVVEPPVCPAGISTYLMLNEIGNPILFKDVYDNHDGGCAGNCPSPTAGIVDGAMSFTRAGQTGIDISAHADFDWGAEGSFTIEYWMKGISGVTCDGAATSDNEVIVGRDDSGTNLHIWTGCHAASGGLAVFQLRDTSGAGLATYGTTPINDGEWHHVAFVRDGPNDLNHVYVDGDLEGSETYDYTQGFGSPSAAINIGWLNLSGYYWYNGLVDEVAIYNAALDIGVIQDHYNNGNGKTYCSFAPEAPIITSNPVTHGTVGVPYNYDVYASGNPAPTYSLTAAPNDMSIDPVSGLIDWLPSSVGDYSVTVEATNTEGFDTQTYTITVETPPSVFYSQDFETYAPGENPDDWFDTEANNSMIEDDNLFKIYDLSGNKVFGTTSTQTNIHSHYVGAGSDSLSGYRYTGRMLMTNANGGIGVTFHSLYPNSDNYYRLRRYNDTAFHISPHGTTISGVTNTDVIPLANTWYWFIVEIEDTGTQTEVRAKVWADGSPEPDGWQVDAYDASTSRITAGTFGVWSYTSGSKYWDDLVVEPLTPVYMYTQHFPLIFK